MASKVKVSFNSKFEKRVQSLGIADIATVITMINYYKKNTQHSVLDVTTKVNRNSNKTKLEITRKNNQLITVVATVEDDLVKFCDVKLQADD